MADADDDADAIDVQNLFPRDQVAFGLEQLADRIRAGVATSFRVHWNGKGACLAGRVTLDLIEAFHETDENDESDGPDEQN